MGLRKKRKQKSAWQASVTRRARRLHTADLIPWADAVQGEIGRSLLEWQRSGDITHAIDAKQAAEALVVICDEVEKRSTP